MNLFIKSIWIFILIFAVLPVFAASEKLDYYNAPADEKPASEKLDYYNATTEEIPAVVTPTEKIPEKGIEPSEQTGQTQIQTEEPASTGTTYIEGTVEEAEEQVITPVVTDPGENVTSGTPFTIEWTDVPGTTYYEIQLDSSSSFVNASTEETNSTSAAFTKDLATPTTFYFHVRANTDSGSGPWSNVVDITVLPEETK